MVLLLLDELFELLEDEFELLLLDELFELLEDEFELELLELFEDEFELLLLDELPATCRNSSCTAAGGRWFSVSAGKAAWAAPKPAIAAPVIVEILIMCFDIPVSIAFNRHGLAIKRRTSGGADYSRWYGKKLRQAHKGCFSSSQLKGRFLIGRGHNRAGADRRHECVNGFEGKRRGRSRPPLR